MASVTRGSLLAAGVGAALALPAAAQAGSHSFELHGRLALDAGAFHQDSDFTPLAVGGRADVTADWTYLFDNGVAAGVSLDAAAERDHRRRDPRGGLAGFCPAGTADCPAAGGVPVRSPVSGYYTAGPASDRGVRASLEAGYLFLRGSWGEASLGRDQGAAARFSLTAPSILSAAGVADPMIDLTGLGAAITVNDLSGPSAKLTVASPRLLGFRLGASFTPRDEADGLDQGFAGGPPTLRARNIAELGVSFAHTWRNGMETDFAGTYARAEDGSGLSVFGPIESFSLGAAVSDGPWRVGGGYLSSDNGWAAGGRAYRAGAVGATYEQRKWAFMAQIGISEDDLSLVRTRAATLAARRSLTPQTTLAAGVSATWREVPRATGAVRGWDHELAAGPFIEFVWRL